MKEGKVPENVLKRSILKKTGIKREEVLVGAGVGLDSATLMQGEELTLVSVAVCTDSNVDFSVISATNNLLASGAEPVGIEVALCLPVTVGEEEIKHIMGIIDDTCRKLKISLLGGHSEITSAVIRPVVSVTAIGKAHKKKAEFKACPGDDIVVTKWIGLEGTARIVRAKEQELLNKFPSKMIYDAKNFSEILSVAAEAAPAVKSGVTAMHDISGGGIFAALWELAESSGVGLEIELKKIPVKQETIEICNYFDINPYELLSGGCMLISTTDGNRLVMDLKQEGINACVIGKVTKTNDRVVINGDIRRFLEPSRNDEIHKAITE